MTLQVTTVPVNSDSVGCSPVFEIRETQNATAAINTFGNNNPVMGTQTSTTQYSNNTPGPPFHLSNVNSIDMNAQSASFLPSHMSPNGGINQARSVGSHDFTPAGFAFPDGTEMDTSGDRSGDQPSPATISSQSRGGSTSQSSYSPGNLNEHHLPYRASPKMPSGHVPGATMGSATVFQNFGSNSELFSNAFSTPGNMNEGIYSEGLMVGTEWEYSAMTTGTGMTPMADGTWDSMLESVTMGWDTLGPPQDHTGTTPRS